MTIARIAADNHKQEEGCSKSDEKMAGAGHGEGDVCIPGR